MNLLLKLFLTVVVLLCMVLSCKKKAEEVILAPDLSTEKEISIADADINSVFRDIDYYQTRDTNIHRVEASLPYSYNFKNDTIRGTFTGLLTIDYAGQGHDMLSRSGRVRCFLKGKKTKGTYRDSIVFEDTKIGGREIKGNILTTQTPAKNNIWIFNISIKAFIENDQGAVLTFDSEKIKTRSGQATSDTLDDSWSIVSVWKGTNGKGENILTQTTSPLLIKVNCSFRHYVKGVIDFKNETTGITQRIKYGDGQCDNWASCIDKKGKETRIYID